MKDYIFLGSSPCDEKCAQVGEYNYHEQARKECRAYINQLWRELDKQGVPKEHSPEGFDLVIKSESHDFGTYYEVAAKYDDYEEEEAACQLAFQIECNLPLNWDDGAKKELGI